MRGRKPAPQSDGQTEKAREANRRAYAKKTGKPIIPKKIKQDTWWEILKKKHAGKPRIEKSINKPFFLTHSMAEREALKGNE